MSEKCSCGNVITREPHYTCPDCGHEWDAMFTSLQAQLAACREELERTSGTVQWLLKNIHYDTRTPLAHGDAAIVSIGGGDYIVPKEIADEITGLRQAAASAAGEKPK